VVIVVVVVGRGSVQALSGGKKAVRHLGLEQVEQRQRKAAQEVRTRQRLDEDGPSHLLPEAGWQGAQDGIRDGPAHFAP